MSILFQSYVDEGIPATPCPPWLSRMALEESIRNEPHASECALDVVCFIQGELQLRVQDVFSILLSAKDTVRLFGEKLNLSCIVAVPHAQCWPRLIMNLSAPLDKETPSVNNTTDRQIAL